MHLRVGQIIKGHYEILRLIGRGGMGEVYKARDKALSGQIVAIKNINTELLKQGDLKKRFQREIISAFSLHHPNIVRGIEYIDEEGLDAFAMEYVNGGDLLSFMKGRPDHRRAMPVLVGILLGLAAIHDAGMVHRDLKPENILLTTELLPKISDFGAARFLGSQSITQEGVWLGTPMYIAPEYIETGEMDERGDIFAWGVIAYELIAGRSPYQAKTKTDLITARFSKAPTVIEVNGKIPLALSLIIEKAMEVRILERYQSVRELLKDLEGLG